MTTTEQARAQALWVLVRSGKATAAEQAEYERQREQARRDSLGRQR